MTPNDLLRTTQNRDESPDSAHVIEDAIVEFVPSNGPDQIDPFTLNHVHRLAGLVAACRDARIDFPVTEEELLAADCLPRYIGCTATPRYFGASIFAATCRVRTR